MSRLLIILGVILIFAGVIWHFGEKFGLGTLPGDIHIKRENISFYFPLTTSLVISIIASLILFIWSRFRQ